MYFTQLEVTEHMASAQLYGYRHEDTTSGTKIQV